MEINFFGPPLTKILGTPMLLESPHASSILSFLLLLFLLSCRHSRNSRTYRAPRKDVIDYTRHSRAKILRVVWIYRAIKMPSDIRIRATHRNAIAACVLVKVWRGKRIAAKCLINCANFCSAKKETVTMRTLHYQQVCKRCLHSCIFAVLVSWNNNWIFYNSCRESNHFI